MTTSRQVTANRANARASTGPRSAAGKMRAARNAMRFGLSIPVMADPALNRDVEALARLIAGGGANAKMVELALPIAEAQVDLLRVRRARNAILSGGPGNMEKATITRPGTELALPGDPIQDVESQMSGRADITSSSGSTVALPVATILVNMARQMT